MRAPTKTRSRKSPSPAPPSTSTTADPGSSRSQERGTSSWTGFLSAGGAAQVSPAREGWVAQTRSHSIKIMRHRLRPRNPQRPHPLRLHRNHVVLILQLPLNQQKLLVHHHNMILLKKLRRNNRIRNSGFIFQPEKHKSFRLSRPLPRNPHAPPPHLLPLPPALQTPP